MTDNVKAISARAEGSLRNSDPAGVTNKSLTERLRASPTSDIMLEAADALDEAAQKHAALLEDYKELESQLAAVGAGGVSSIMGQPAQPAASVTLDFDQTGKAGPFPVVDGSVAVPAVTVMDLVRMVQPAASAEPIELQGIAPTLDEGNGFWRSCSGCHESNEGHPTGPYSKTLRCHLGGGCGECGGIGAVWDDTDYDEMADYMA